MNGQCAQSTRACTQVKPNIAISFVNSTLLTLVGYQKLKKMAIDDEYDLAEQKGNVLLQLLLADDRKAGQRIVPPRESVQSNFTALEDMDDQGFEGEVTEACVDNTTIALLAPVLQALGVEHKMACDGGKNVMVKHVHSQDWSLDGTA
tara:strand:+ start:7826 stop:8269 length:444 start_codon:yes stop_codon:yes gene_type:complete